VINALSVDLENWDTSEFLGGYLPEDKEDQVVEAVTPILNLLAKYDTKATFFVLGTVAEAHPDLVRAIFDMGHEVASHTYSHERLSTLGEERFEQEIKKSVELLTAITGEKPVGFRSPYFSLDNSTRWALKVLSRYGFSYDSSIFPVNAQYYGSPKAPLHVYRPSLQDITREDAEGPIAEFPLTVIKLLGQNIPVAGGFWFRALPYWFLRLAIRKVNQTRPAIIYVHPWETYRGTPRLSDIPRFSKFVTYWGSYSALSKLERLLKEFRFEPICSVIDKS